MPKTIDVTGLEFRDGVAEPLPFVTGSARAVVAATTAHWFERRISYAEMYRILAPGGILAIVEYVRDREGSPIAAALIEFMSRYGSERAYAPPDYRRELAEAAGFGASEAVVPRRQLRLDLCLYWSCTLVLARRRGYRAVSDRRRTIGCARV